MRALDSAPGRDTSAPKVARALLRAPAPDDVNMAQLRALQPQLQHAAATVETLRCAFASTFAPSLRMAALQPRHYNKAGYLLRAIMAGDRALVRLLLVAGAPVNAPDSLGNTALHWAVLMQDEELSTLLRAHGADAALRNKLHATAERYQDRTGYWFAGRQVKTEREAVPVYWTVDAREPQLVPVAALPHHVGFSFLERSVLGYGVLYQLGTCGVLQGNAAASLAAVDILDASHLVAAPRLALRYYNDVLGWGVVAAQDIAAGAVVGYYAGEVLEASEYAQRGSLRDGNAYGLTISSALGEWIIDSRCADSLCGRLNHGAEEAVNTTFEVVWLDGAPAARMVATRPIPRGQEARICYGAQYWEALGKKPL